MDAHPDPIPPAAAAARAARHPRAPLRTPASRDPRAPPRPRAPRPSIARIGPLALALAAVLAAPAAAQAVSFAHGIIDAALPGDRDCKSVGDIDGDGFIDVVVAGGVNLVWYAWPDWTRTFISTSGVNFTTDMQVGDVDGDGDLDAIVPDGPAGALSWFENPRPGGDPAADPWPRHPIGDHGTWAHDVEVGDVDGDGRLDVVSRKGATKLWLQSGPDAWTPVTVSTRPAEGLALGDIDRDGDLDVAINGWWIETPPDPLAGPWTEHFVASGWPSQVAVHLADLDSDGRLDIVLAPSESTGRLSWYPAPPVPEAGPWTEQLIDPAVQFLHTFKSGDVDLDGDLDLVTAEMHQSSNPDWVLVRLNQGGGAGWLSSVVDTTGSHNLRLADLGTDGDLDIVGANWLAGSPIEWWENLTDPAVFAYGAGLAGSGGQVPVATISAAPEVGDSGLRLTLTGAAPGTGCLVAVGAAPANVPVSGGYLLADLLILAVGSTDAQGRASWLLDATFGPGLLGLTGYVQWVVADAGAPQGLAFTAGLGFVVQP